MWHDMISKLIAALLRLPTYFDRHRRRNMYKTNFSFCDAAAGITHTPPSLPVMTSGGAN